MNLGQARAELEARGYSRFADARLSAWLNQARVRFEDFPFDWPWLKDTAAGSAPLTVSGLRRVLSVSDTQHGRSLDPLDPDVIVQFGADANLTTAGVPSSWYLASSSSVAVFPVQAVAVSVRYVKFSPALVDDSDEPLIPDDYHSDWVDMAEVLVLRYGVKDFPQAAALDLVLQARLGEIAGVFAMQGEAAFQQTLVTGASSDG